MKRVGCSPISIARACRYRSNCPGWVTSFYRRIKWWVPKHTQSKIRLLDSDYRGELLKVMDPKTLQSMLATFAQHPGRAITGGEETDGEAVAAGSADAAPAAAGVEVVSIAAGKTVERELLVPCGSAVRWQFEVTSGGDVEFSVELYDDDADTLHSSGDVGGGATDVAEAAGCGARIVVSPKRFSAADGEVSGRHVLATGAADGTCLVVLRWSNVHSWMRPRAVRLLAHVEDPASESSADVAAAVEVRSVQSPSTGAIHVTAVEWAEDECQA